MKPWQLDELRRALERRREALVEELRRDAARLREERTPDTADDAVLDVLVDTDRAELTRDAAELRRIEQARRRLADGSYGICVDCGVAIPYQRLMYEPVAERCLECQARHEKTYRR